MALIIRWSTKEVTKRPFKIVYTFSYSEGMNCCYPLLWRWINKSHLWLVHLFLKLDFLDLTLICWREDTLGMGMLVLSWIPDWQKRRGALDSWCPYSHSSILFHLICSSFISSGKWLSSEACTFIKLILEGRLSKTGIRLPRQKLHEVNSFPPPPVFILIFIILLIHVNFSCAE